MHFEGHFKPTQNICLNIVLYDFEFFFLTEAKGEKTHKEKGAIGTRLYLPFLLKQISSFPSARVSC